MKELLTPGGEHHGIGDGEGLVMTKNEDPPLQSPKRTPDLASRWRTGFGGGSISLNAIILSPWFFLEICDFIVSGDHQRGHQAGTTHLGAPGEGACPGGLCSPRGPPPVVIGSSIFLLFWNKSPKSFVPFRELLFLHKNNTMIVLLKTASVRG